MQAVRAAVQVRPGLADERRAGAVAVRDGGGADPADRERRSRRPRTRCRSCSAATPGRSRAASRSTRSRCRACPRACPRSSSSAAPTSLQAEQTLIAANAQIGAAKALYFPTISLTGAFGTREHRAQRPLHGPVARLELRRVDRRPDLHRRRDQRAGRAGRGRRRRRRSPPTSYSIQNAFADVENALVANAEARRPARGAGPARGGALRVFEARAAAVRRRLHAVHDRAAGRAAALPRRAEPGERSARSSTHRSSASTRRSAADGWTRRTSSRPSRWPAVCRRATRRARGRRPNAEGVGAREDLARMAITTANESAQAGDLPVLAVLANM